MIISEINPHIRLVDRFLFSSQGATFQVKDCRIFYIISGEIEIFIENQQYILNPDSMFYCCGGSIYNIKADEGTELIAVNFDLSQRKSRDIMPHSPVKLDDTHTPTDKYNIDIENGGFLNSHLYIENGTEFFHVLRNIINEFSSRELFFREKSSALLKNLLIDLSRMKNEKTKNTSDTVLKAADYIKSNFRINLKNKEIADIVGYHEYYLNRLFLKHMGVSMHQYVLETRLEEAKKLLISTTIQLSEIAEKCGFNSNAHLTACFKQNYNISPLKYREKFKNKI